MIPPILAFAPTLVVGALPYLASDAGLASPADVCTTNRGQLDGLLESALPAGWRADIGIPVNLSDGTLLQLYGDTWQLDGFARNTVVIGDTVVSPAIADSANGTYFWPGDATELPDGSLFVIMGEVRNVDGGLGFEPVDTDAFVVSDPRSPASWRFARKVEDGPWSDQQVQLIDGFSMAVTRDPYGFDTTLWEYSPSEPWGSWTELGGSFPESHGVFAPAQTADGWFGFSWEMWTTATLWQSSGPGGPWKEVAHISTNTMTYDHGVNAVAGEVVYRWSNGEASQRPEFCLLG